MPTRRAFLHATASALAATPLACTHAPPAVPMPTAYTGPIIDTHQHVWDLTRFALPWLARAGHLNRSFSPADYADATRGLNVTRAVYVEVAVAGDQREREADAVIALCAARDTRTAAAVIALDPGLDPADFRRVADRYAKSPFVKGIRQPFRRGVGRDANWLANLRHVAGIGWTFDLQGGADHLPEMTFLAAACPDTRFTLDHCGSPNLAWFAADADEGKQAARRAWRDGVARLADRPNVVCKISGVVETADAIAPAPLTPDACAAPVNHCFDRFGPARSVFSGNWPVCLRAGATLAQWVGILRAVTAHRTPAFQRQLFHDTAARWYALA